jgi:hypothetical protein
MQNKSQNKAMTPETTAQKAQESYFFAGGGEYEPISVVASSQEEALKKWEAVRKAVVKPQSTADESPTLQDKNVVE